ncbi:hypothetical protein SAMN02910456_01038 [Ruminococcaceae bacterium YRB3002]|nr:hypothetical protein SAMN02910456_01038 [Ruminococcaceae bacterium YRB3002]
MIGSNADVLLALILVGVQLLLWLSEAVLGAVSIPLRGKYAWEIGVFLLLSGLAGLLSNSSVFLAMIMPVDLYSKTVTILGMVLTFAGFAAVIPLGVYAWRRYRSRLALVIVCVLPVVRTVVSFSLRLTVGMHMKLLNSPFNDLLAAMGLSGDHYVEYGILFVECIASLFSVAMWAILFIVYRRNVNKEPVLPFLWLFFVIEAVICVIVPLTRFVGTVWWNTGDAVMFLVTFVAAAVGPACGVYVVWGMRRKD